MSVQEAQEAWQLSDDTAAAAYERDFVPAYFRQWPPIIADLLEARAGDRALDVGCGTGILARELAARAGPTGRVTGLDLNPGMLTVARRIAPEIAWRQGDAQALPFADGDFDIVGCQMALMFFPDKAGALAEMGRVLAQGGRLAVAVPATIDESPGYRTLAGILRREAGEGAAGMVEGYFATGDALRALAEAAGIGAARIEARDGTMRFPSLDTLIRVEIKGSPLAELVDDAAYGRVLEAARRDLAAFVDPGGAVAIPLPARILVARKG